MSKLKWDERTKRKYETGVDRVVLYVGTKSAAWSGVTAVNESPSGAEPTKIYADNIVYGVLMSPEENALTIEAYAYPELFDRCIGKAEFAVGAYLDCQNRVPFVLCWRTMVKDDSNRFSHYKIHIAYQAYAQSSEDSNSTISDSPQLKTYSFNATTIPVENVSNIVLDSRAFDKAGMWNALKTIEDALYGTDSKDPKIVYPNDIDSIRLNATTVRDDQTGPVLDNNGNYITTIVCRTTSDG